MFSYPENPSDPVHHRCRELLHQTDQRMNSGWQKAGLRRLDFFSGLCNAISPLRWLDWGVDRRCPRVSFKNQGASSGPRAQLTEFPKSWPSGSSLLWYDTPKHPHPHLTAPVQIHLLWNLGSDVRSRCQLHRVVMTMRYERGLRPGARAQPAAPLKGLIS